MRMANLSVEMNDKVTWHWFLKPPGFCEHNNKNIPWLFGTLGFLIIT